MKISIRLMLMLALACGLACSRNPEARKQRFFDSGNRYFEQAKYRAAVLEYQNAIDVDPNFGAAQKKLAEAYVRSGETARALKAYVRAADLLPGDVGVQVTTGQFLLMAQQFEQAAARADVALKADPTNVEALVLRGNAVGGLKDFDRALQDIEEAIRLDPAKGATYTQLALVQLARGQRTDAEETFKKAVSLAPDWAPGRLALGNYYWMSGRVPDAEQAFAEAVRLAPRDISANRVMAALYVSTGRPAQAEPYVKQLAEAAPSSPYVLALADYYQALGRSADAIKVLEPVSSGKNAMTGAPERLALAYAAAGDRPKGAAIIDGVLARSPKNADAQLVKARLLMADGRKDDAFDQVRAAAAAAPTSVPAQFTLGQMYAARGDVDGAAKAFQAVLQQNPRATAAQVELSKLRLASRNTPDAVRFAEEAVRAAPRDLNARLNLARSLVVAKNLERAESLTRAIVADYPYVAAAHVQAGYLASAKGNPSAARAAYEKALAIDKNSLEATGGLIAVDLAARDFGAAKARVDARVEANPSSPQWLLLAARTHAAASDAAAAEQLLRRTIEADANLLPAYTMLAQVYLSRGKLDEARAEFDRMAERQSQPVAALTMAGMILETQGNHAEAGKRFERAVAADAKASVAANNLAWIYAENGGDLNRALELAQTATTTTPDVPELMDTLGWVYFKKDLPRLALPLFERAAEKQPGSPIYLYHLGLTQSKIGDSMKARAALEKALSSKPPAALKADIERAVAQVASTKSSS